jgi:hypothetical protein
MKCHFHTGKPVSEKKPFVRDPYGSDLREFTSPCVPGHRSMAASDEGRCKWS